MQHSYVTTIREALRDAANGRLASGCVYLKSSAPPNLDDQCLVKVADDPVDESPLRVAYPFEGLGTQDIEDTAHGASGFQDPPSDELLLQAFIYYWRFDAWLPFPNAPEPPPWEETKRNMDREFVDFLGPERSDVKCKRDECGRGAIRDSVLCKAHHFEMVKNERYPFTRDA